MSRKKKRIDIFDLLPADAVEAADKLGYELLAEHGYDTEGSRESKEKRRALREALKANGEELRYSGYTDNETGKIKIRYSLYHGEKIVDSRSIEFFAEDADGENRTDQKGPASST